MVVVIIVIKGVRVDSLKGHYIGSDLYLGDAVVQDKVTWILHTRIMEKGTIPITVYGYIAVFWY